MRRQLLGAGLLLAAFVCLPGTDALGQDKKKKKGDWDKPKSAAVDSGKLKAGEYAGTIVSPPGTDRTFVLEIESKNQVANGVRPGGKGRPAQIQYKWNTTKQQVEFQLSEKAKVRTLSLPEQFDEKGNVIKLSKSKLAEMKGKDTKLPGYESALDKLEAGQKVSLRLAAAPAKAATKDKDADEAKPDKKMQVNLIVITSETSGTTAPAPKGKKK